MLELGSGLGLGGLAAAGSAEEVLLTDRPGPVLEGLWRTVALNAVAAPARLTAAPLEWGACSHDAASPRHGEDLCHGGLELGEFELIIGEDPSGPRWTAATDRAPNAWKSSDLLAIRILKLLRCGHTV